MPAFRHGLFFSLDVIKDVISTSGGTDVSERAREVFPNGGWGCTQNQQSAASTLRIT
jgi:hypothetical protein